MRIPGVSPSAAAWRATPANSGARPADPQSFHSACQGATRRRNRPGPTSRGTAPTASKPESENPDDRLPGPPTQKFGLGWATISYNARRIALIMSLARRQNPNQAWLKTLKPLVSVKTWVALVVGSAALGLHFPSPARAAVTSVVYTGKITSIPANNLVNHFAVNDTFQLTLVFNQNFNLSCAGNEANTGVNYQWNDNGCSTKFFSSVSFTGSTGTYSPVEGNAVYAYDSSQSPSPAQNPFFIGSLGPDSGLKAFNDSSLIPDAFNITSNGAYYGFVNSYLQPYINVGSSLPSMSDFLQFYYSSSYYRDYSISSTALLADSSTVLPIGSIGFGEGPLEFQLTGMDIIGDVPAPLPIFGAAIGFAQAQSLRKRLGNRQSHTSPEG